MPLRVVVPGQIWCSVYSVNVGPLDIRSRATLVKLSNGLLWVHSPMRVYEDLAKELSEIGQVGYVVASNLTHHFYYQSFLDSFPNAHGFFAPGLDKKVYGLEGESLGRSKSLPWSQDLESVFVAGLPVLNETVWFHVASGTLIVTDLLFSFARSNSIFMRTIARLLGVCDRLGMSRTMKWSVKSRDDFKLSINQIESWDINRIILAHDQIIEHEAKQKLINAFAWIKT